MPVGVTTKIHELEHYLSYLEDKWQVPNKNKDWDGYYKRVLLLESNPETWSVAQELWNLHWILSELENIQSSVEQIETCKKDARELALEKKLELNSIIND
jgi:hypothetical protein